MTGAASSLRSSTTPSDARLTVARALGVKGLKGGIRIEVLTDFPDSLLPGAHVWPEGAVEPMRIQRVEPGGRNPVIYLEGVTTREQAEPLVGRFLEVPRRELAEGEFFWSDLIGLRVEEPDGRAVGDLVEVLRVGGSEVYRVVGPGGERLVPALRSAVRRIDLVERLMVVEPDDAEEVR